MSSHRVHVDSGQVYICDEHPSIVDGCVWFRPHSRTLGTSARRLAAIGVRPPKLAVPLQRLLLLEVADDE